MAVGIKLPDGTISTAAIIHLVLFGSGTYAPWEVVGTDDRTFTVDSPYGGTARSPVTVGGTITGVDESIRVTVHTLSAQVPAGAYCCRAVGGIPSPWSASVTFLAAPGQVITIAAATGGHVAAVERFAVTGARAADGQCGRGDNNSTEALEVVRYATAVWARAWAAARRAACSVRPGIRGRCSGGGSGAGRLRGMHERRIHHGSHDAGCGSDDACRGGRRRRAASAGLRQHDPPGAAVGGGDQDRIRPWLRGGLRHRRPHRDQRTRGRHRHLLPGRPGRLGAPAAARLTGSYPADDLAVIQVTGAAHLVPARFADSSKLQVGDIVLAMGNPLGLASSVTDGIMAVGRTVSEPQEAGSPGATLPDVIQTSAAINPGNSGGALADLAGQVVGIPTLAAADQQLGGAAPGIGFAIPSSIVTDIAGQIIRPATSPTPTARPWA